jgi:hypothetical protein
VAFPLVDILFITKEPLLIPKVSRNEWNVGHIFYEYLLFSTF